MSCSCTLVLIGTLLLFINSAQSFWIFKLNNGNGQNQQVKVLPSIKPGSYPSQRLVDDYAGLNQQKYGFEDDRLSDYYDDANVIQKKLENTKLRITGNNDYYDDLNNIIQKTLNRMGFISEKLSLVVAYVKGDRVPDHPNRTDCPQCQAFVRKCSAIIFGGGAAALVVKMTYDNTKRWFNIKEMLMKRTIGGLLVSGILYSAYVACAYPTVANAPPENRDDPAYVEHLSGKLTPSEDPYLMPHQKFYSSLNKFLNKFSSIARQRPESDELAFKEYDRIMAEREAKRNLIQKQRLDRSLKQSPPLVSSGRDSKVDTASK